VIKAKKDYFPTEASLCAAFLSWVQHGEGKFHHGEKTPKWTPYAETAGWDILLVAADGTQIGVQAKLRLNWKVVDQTLPGGWDAWHEKGPDYRAVLVPEGDEGAKKLLCAAGVMTFECRYREGDIFIFDPRLDMEHWNGGWHYWSPKQREELPEFVPDVIAGDSGPVPLTKWKIAALRVIARLDLKGHVTRQDFRELSLDPRRWVGPNGWLKSTETPGQYVRGPGLDFDKQHPVVYAQVLAEARAQLERFLEPT
jgi:hypothetical protein